MPSFFSHASDLDLLLGCGLIAAVLMSGAASARRSVGRIVLRSKEDGLGEALLAAAFVLVRRLVLLGTLSGLCFAAQAFLSR
jgi:hypothetical protein